MRYKQFILPLLATTLLILVLVAFMVPTRGNYGVKVGDTFEYTINQASGDFKYKTDSIPVDKTVAGYTLDDDTISVGSGLKVTVTSVSSSFVLLKFTSGSATNESRETYYSFLFGFLKLALLPFFAIDLVPSSSIEFDVDNGVSLGNWAFVAPSDMDWLELAEDFNKTAIEMNNITYPGLDLTLVSEAIFENSLTQFRIWLYMTGNYKNATEQIDLEINHKIMFAYEVDTGSLLGYRYEDDINGTLEGAETAFKMYLEVIRNEYTLPPFEIDSIFPFPSFEWLFAPPALTLLGLIILWRKKNKNA
ncbi:MAG: choice-of-anchor S family protein [Candidatus Hodarchaeota archaeon]